MLYSQTSEYALCILGRMAEVPAAAHQARDLAAHLGIPASYAAKVLQRLRDAGFVRSNRGRGGGFRLARDPATVQLLEVVNFLDGPAPGGCILARPDCSDEGGCPLHAYWARTKVLREQMLLDVTVADLTCTHPLPVGQRSAPGLPSEPAPLPRP